MTMEFGIVRVSKGELVENGIFIPQSRLGELDGYSIRYLITHGTHKNAVKLDYNQLIIWDGMPFIDLLSRLNCFAIKHINDILSQIPCKINNNKIKFIEED